MEALKKLEEICQPDVRMQFFARLTADGTFRRNTLEDFHKAADSIRLHNGVPENIRSLFETARNLIVYSWFFYPFNVTAELCAYTTVELAVRTKAQDFRPRSNFARLLEQAVARNWIRDEGFSHIKRKHEHFRRYNQDLPPEFQWPDTPLAQEYCKRLTTALPKLRNFLAHGSNSLHNHGAMTVRICADLINQLFEGPKTELNTKAKA